MSLKTCLRLVPLLRSNIKPHNLLLCNTQHINIGKLCTNKFNNFNQIRCCSTKVNEAKNEKTQVYYGMLTPQIRAVKWFSLSSSFVGIIAQPFLYKELASTGNIPVIIAAYSFIGFFTLVTPILLHFITKKYITHLEYKSDSDIYVAKTVNFFCMTKETEFTPDQVKIPDVPGMFTSFLANGKPLFLDPRQFEYPEHYARIMGYDKPLDFKLYEQPPENKN